MLSPNHPSYNFWQKGSIVLAFLIVLAFGFGAGALFQKGRCERQHYHNRK